MDAATTHGVSIECVQRYHAEVAGGSSSSGFHKGDRRVAVGLEPEGGTAVRGKNFTEIFGGRVDPQAVQVTRRAFRAGMGSRGCPLLRREPYTADRLEDQFAEQAREFLRDPKKNYVDLESKTVFLSPVFSWFREDFGKTNAEVIALVAKHFEAPERKILAKGGFTIKCTQFDWGVNQSPPSEK